MIYPSLSVEHGGGIHPCFQQLEPDDSPHLFIGLGGTGIDCLRAVKKQIFARFTPDDDRAEAPRYPYYQFLAIDDCDSFGEKTTVGLDPETECLDIWEDILDLIRDRKELYKNPSLQWYSDENNISCTDEPLIRSRQNARLLLMLHCKEITEALRKKLLLINSGNPKKSTSVHIMTGLSGNLGSGIMLDVCYLVQKIAKDVLPDHHLQVYGYFFLPSVNLERVDNENVRDLIKVNGFAAMKELDYCLNFETNCDRWHQNYGQFEIDTNEPPVRIAYLVSAQDPAGRIISGGYRYAIQTVVEHLMTLLFKNTGIGYGDPEYSCTVLHQMNYFSAAQRTPKLHGGCDQYCVLGAAGTYAPVREILNYMAANVIAHYDELPTDCRDTRLFISEYGFGYRRLVDRIGKDIDHLEDIAEIRSVLERNRKALEASACEELKNALLHCACDPKKGVAYAASILKSFGKESIDMIGTVQGYLLTNRHDLESAREAFALKEQELYRAVTASESGKPTDIKTTRQYQEALRSYFELQTKIQVYTETQTFLHTFESRIKTLHREFFAPLERTMENLRDTFRSNLIHLEDAPAVRDDFSVPLISLHDEELKSKLDAALGEADKESVLSQLVARLIDSAECRTNDTDEIQLRAVVSSFFSEQFRQITAMTMDDFMAIKFGVRDEQQLSSLINYHVLQTLNKKAAPRICMNMLSHSNEYAFCIVPERAPVVLKAAKNLHDSYPHPSIIKNPFGDTITVIREYIGFPLYMLTELESYLAIYSTKMFPGLHIYEGSPYDERDFRKLYDLIPLSLLSDPKNE